MAFGLIVWGVFFRAPSQPKPQTNLVGSLIADATSFDFGTVSMAKGKVNRVFTVRNSTAAPVLLSKLYTSCMCTEATILKDGKRFGPYGMPGHGPLGIIGEEIKPGDSFDVLVTFDPRAHGPAGVGQVIREIYLEGPSAPLLTLQISANVTP